MRGHALGIVAIAASLAVFTETGLAASPPASGPLNGTVVHVADGATIHVRVGERVERVRYLGVEVPTVRHGGASGRASPGHPPSDLPRAVFARSTTAAREATFANINLVSGRAVRLEVDRRRRDEGGRLLAWVWVNDVLVNGEMVRRGYARTTASPSDGRYRALLEGLEAEARQAGRGLWTRR